MSEQKKDTLVISNEPDWEEKFHEAGLELIVDPMVFRSADVFLRGRDIAASSLSEKNPNKIWKSVSDNIGSVLAFFDALVLSEKLPVIDYGITFDSVMRGQGYLHEVPWICTAVNNILEDKVLVDVHIEGDVSKKAREAAMTSLQSRPEAPPHLEKSVCEELSAFDYQWKPELEGELNELSEDKRAFLRFLYGGLVFTAFAQMSGSGHILQPKRAALLTSMALRESSDDETKLFEELNRRVHATPGFEHIKLEITSLPPVLPYLLSKEPKGPLDLLKTAYELRKTEMVNDYRNWRKRLIQNWRKKGEIQLSQEKNVKQLIATLQKQFSVPQKLPVEVGVDCVAITPYVKFDVPVGAIWGWILSNIPGHRYLKLLHRLSHAAYSYPHFDRYLSTLWNSRDA